MSKLKQRGFTLIELSIVLVIIGLIVGGVLVGQDLIRAAEVRAQISQIERYNTAVNTFRGKYDALPGDLGQQVASKFGFTTRGANEGQGDGNGIIEGWTSQDFSYYSAQAGESTLFWVDLTTANGQNIDLIDGSFSSASATVSFNAYANSAPFVDAYIPKAKIGRGNFLYVYSLDEINYYGLSAVSILGDGIESSPALTVSQAYSIDKKIDDGLPQLGNVTAIYMSNRSIPPFYWANGPDALGITISEPYTTLQSGSATTCFDNGGSNGVVQTYSVEQNGGNGVNCALSFRFQ